MGLTETILSKIQETSSTLPDYDQRSALGMAHTWVKGKEPEWSSIESYQKRDDLARSIIAAFEASEAEQEEMIEALAAARRKINEPYLVESPLGKAKQKGEYKKSKLVAVESEK